MSNSDAPSDADLSPRVSGPVAAPPPIAADSRRVTFLGSAFDPLDLHTAGRMIMRQARRAETFSWVIGRSSRDILNRSQEAERRAAEDKSAWLVLNADRLVSRIARWHKVYLPASPMPDLVEDILETELNPTETITVIGAAPHVVSTLARRYEFKAVRHHPLLDNAFDSDSALEAAASFAFKKPARFTFIAADQRTAAEIARRLAARNPDPGVALCVGTALAELAEVQPSPPDWVRRHRLETAYRAATQPLRSLDRIGDLFALLQLARASKPVRD